MSFSTVNILYFTNEVKIRREISGDVAGCWVHNKEQRPYHCREVDVITWRFTWRFALVSSRTWRLQLITALRRPPPQKRRHAGYSTSWRDPGTLERLTVGRKTGHQSIKPGARPDEAYTPADIAEPRCTIRYINHSGIFQQSNGGGTQGAWNPV